MRIGRIPGLCFGAGLMAVAAHASATSSRIPPTYVERPLVLPEGVLRFDAGGAAGAAVGSGRWPYVDGQLKHVAQAGPDFDFLNPGLTYGIAPDLEFGAVLPIQLSPDFEPEDPRAHVLYQFQRREVELGIFGGVRLGLFDETSLTGGLPVLWHLKSTLRLDTGGFLQFVFGSQSRLNMFFPAALPIQLSDRLYVGPESGLNIFSVFESGSDLQIPLGGFIGFGIGGGGGTLGDVYARLRMPDVANGFNPIEVVLGTDLYFDL